MNPLISVLIPTFNVEKYVEEAVNSILFQTYSELELIIVDDGSTDKTYEILSNLQKKDSRIKLFRNANNLRIAETLNFAYSQSSGELIARMDGDDISLRDRLMKQYKYMMDNPEIDLLGLCVKMIDEEGRDIHIEEYSSNITAVKMISEYASPVPHFWLAKREVYKIVGPYRIPPVEDYDFILRAQEHGFTVSNLPEVQYLQRVRIGNTATASGLIQRKTISYVKALHKERVKNSSVLDSFNNEDLKNRLGSTLFERLMFRYSSKFHFKYFSLKSRNIVSALIFRFLSVLLYPSLTLSEILDRYRIKNIKAKFR